MSRNLLNLTPRQMEMAYMVAHGMTRTTIAATLWVSLKTVDTHMARIYEMAGLSGNDVNALAVLSCAIGHYEAGDIDGALALLPGAVLAT